MRDFALSLPLVLILAFSAIAQPPVFSPPGGAKGKPKPKVAVAKPEPKAEQKTEKQEEPATVAGLMERMRRWPHRDARSAALILAGLGGQSKKPLLDGLVDNDWRIQAGSAFALAEMGDTDAIDPLRRAIANKSNRASLPDLLRAVVKIDPQGGPEAVLPFLGHSSAKIRVAARAALPLELPERYAPDLIALFRSRRTAVRAGALELLGRIRGQGEREEFFIALGDPEATVAFTSSLHLAELGSPKIRTRLLKMAATSPMRQAAYAMLAIIQLEDTHQESLIPDKGAIRQRAQRLLANDDPFYAGVGAVVFANVSYRSQAPAIRQLADQYLCPILIGTVAGGVFFSDYTSLEDLCWRKLALLAGVDLGQNASAWKTWWRHHQEGFVARRELRSVTLDELKRARLRMVRTQPDGSLVHVSLSGDQRDLDQSKPDSPLVLGEKELQQAFALLESSKFFDTRGAKKDPDRLDGSLELELAIPGASMVFRRLHYGPVPEKLRPFCAWLEETRRRLAWQRLVPASATDRVAWLNMQRAFFDRATDERKRQERLLKLALDAWPGLLRVDRILAVSVLKKAPKDWVVANRGALVGLLRHEQRLTEEAADLIDLLSVTADQDVRTAVLDVVTASPSHRSEQVLRRFLDRQPLTGVVVLMRDDRARVRALAAESLRRFDGDREVVNILIQGLKDYEPRVQDACLKSLATMKDERIISMLEAVIASEEHKGLRGRAIEALGMVGRGQAVPRLMELFRTGDERGKWAVVRGLQKAGGRRAIVALTGIVRGSGDLELRKEALDALTSMGGTDVAERLQEVLDKTRDLDIRVMTIGSLAEVIGPRAIPFVRKLMTAEEPEVSRIATLTLARLGATDAAAGLLKLMSRPEGDLAAEHAFQELSFHLSYDPSPPRRFKAYQTWHETYGTLTRLEWFLLEAQNASEGLDAQVDWLAATDLKDLQVEALIRIVERGNRATRIAADATLRRVSALPIDPVGQTGVEAEERADVYRRWLSGRKKVEGKKK
ncbi:MAG: hypothetical protein CMJ83_01525 [Planctomycetes bacterium]|nr:hypothetical protein [Planctomycetota bacterium]